MKVENKVFDQDKNVEMHERQRKTIDRSTDIGAQTLKIVSVLVELLSSLSPTSLPTIASKIAGLANPVAEGIKQVAENKIELVKNKIEIPTLIKKEQLDDLDKTNPIKTGLNQPDFNPDYSTDYGQKNISVSKNISGGLS